MSAETSEPPTDYIAFILNEQITMLSESALCTRGAPYIAPFSEELRACKEIDQNAWTIALCFSHKSTETKPAKNDTIDKSNSRAVTADEQLH